MSDMRRRSGKRRIILPEEVQQVPGRQSKQLKESDPESKRARELRELTRGFLLSQEEERRAFGRELHDSIGQSLTVLNLVLGRIKQVPPNEINSLVDEAQRLGREIAKEVRLLSHSMSAPMLEDAGLLEALINHFESLKTHTGFKTSFKQSGLQRRLPREVEAVTFRIVQECLNNVIRHARVNEADVSIRVEGNTLYLKIEDRGAGFDPETISPDALGIRGIQERAKLSGGKLLIDSSPGAGTCITAEIPLG